MIQKGEHLLRCDLLYCELGDCSLALLCNEAQKQSPCVPVGNHRVRGSSALLDQPILEEAMQQLR
jgi:hypothetical protein